MAPSLPRFIVLKSPGINGKYLSWIKTFGPRSTPGLLRFAGEEVLSPHCKFEVEDASVDENDEGLVHIRCCFNNKYLVRPKDSEKIAAQADRKEEDKSEYSCTLFKPTVSSNDQDVQIVQLLRYVSDGQNVSYVKPPLNDGLYSTKLRDDMVDTFTFIDWETLIILPKYITFKDATGSYLGAHEVDGRNYCKFYHLSDIEDPKIGHEVFNTPDGNIRIKSNYTGKFWRRSPNWILPDSDDTTNSDIDTLFSVTKLDDNTIALRNLGNNEYCRTLSTDGKSYCLNASADTIGKDVHLQVGEYVKKREISHVKFHLQQARICNEEIVHNTTQTTTNETSSPVNKTLKFTYKTEKSQTWNSSVSLKLGIETSIKAGIPSIGEAELKVSAEVETKFEWGETKSESFETESTHTVVVPAMTKVIVNLQAKKATCDIPYSYRQSDTLANETKVSYDKDDGVYSGMNTFNFECQIAEETKLTKSAVNRGSGIAKIETRYPIEEIETRHPVEEIETRYPASIPTYSSNSAKPQEEPKPYRSDDHEYRSYDDEYRSNDEYL